jgi:hypothetical protein
MTLLAMMSSTDLGLRGSIARGQNATFAGSFERDTVTWAFARLAECTLRHLFCQQAVQARYSRWLRDEAPARSATFDGEQGLHLTDLNLDADGRFSCVARPRKGEFISIARHDAFELVLASYYCALDPHPEQEGVCVAHFEGNSAVAIRWASGLRQWLDRHWKERVPEMGFSRRDRVSH